MQKTTIFIRIQPDGSTTNLDEIEQGTSVLLLLSLFHAYLSFSRPCQELVCKYHFLGWATFEPVQQNGCLNLLLKDRVGQTYNIQVTYSNSPLETDVYTLAELIEGCIRSG